MALVVFKGRAGRHVLVQGISEADADAAMDRYACGDAAAFRVVAEFVTPKLFAFVRRRLNDDATAEDVVQQALINMHRARGDFAPGAKLLPWAYSIARGVLIDQLRRRGRERRLTERVLARPMAMFATSPDARHEANEVASALRATYAALPPAQRDAFAMQQTGVKLADAAAQTQTTVTAMKLRLHRAVQRLRACFGADDRKDPT